FNKRDLRRRSEGILALVRPADTTFESHVAQLEIYRRLGPSRRVEIAAALSAQTRELTRAGIRSRHPEYGAGEVELACRRLWLGDDLYSRAWPGAPLLMP
ncbi:MAG TPA: hypothetical protein VIK30_11385, partial [Polyangia bacterium]